MKPQFEEDVLDKDPRKSHVVSTDPLKVAGFEVPFMDKAEAVRALGFMAGKLERLIPAMKRNRWKPSEKAAAIADTLQDIAAIRMATAALIAQGDD